MNHNQYIAVNEWNHIAPHYAPQSATAEDSDMEASNGFDVENVSEMNFYSEGQLISPNSRFLEMQMS